jgi:hypothetical protein
MNKLSVVCFGFHDSDYEECRLLWCDAVWVYCKPNGLEATRSFETSVYNKPTLRHTPEDGILQVINYFHQVNMPHREIHQKIFDLKLPQP